MRIHTLAVATTISLLTSSALVTHSYAQKGISLNPQTSWAVKKVNKNTPDAYCAVARRFKDNMILTMAKNQSRETSIALDFGRKNFETEKTYSVTLDPGAGAQRQFNIRPSTPNAFVIRVGRDQKFLSSLSTTGFLRVELDNSLYNLNLADIDLGQEQLETCLVSSVQPAAGGDAITPSPAFTPDIAELRTEKAALESRLAQLEKENHSLKIAVKSSTQNTPTAVSSDDAVLNDLRSQIQSLKEQNIALRTASENLQTPGREKENVSVVALARENQKLKEKLAARIEYEDNVDLKPQLKTLSNQVSQLESENLSLTRKLSEIKQSDKDTEQLAREVMALKSENKALRDSMKTEAQAQEKFTEMRRTIQNLETNNDTLDSRLTKLMREKNLLADQLGFYEEENSALQRKLSETPSQNDVLAELRKEIQRIEAHNARLVSDKEIEISALENTLTALKTEKARSEAESESEIRQIEKQYEAQIEAVRIKNEALKNEMIALSQGQVSIDTLRQKLSDLENEKADLSLALDTANSKLNKLNEKLALAEQDSELKVLLEGEVSVLEEQISSVQNQNKTLINEIDSLKNKRSFSEKELVSLQNELDDLKRNNQSLREEIAGFVEDNESLSAELQAALSENSTLEARITESEPEYLSQIQALEKSMAHLQNQNLTLKTELAESAEIANQYQILMQQQKDLEQENKDLKLALANADAFNKTLQDNWQRALVELEQLKQEMAEATDLVMVQDISERPEEDNLEALNAELRVQLDNQNKEFLTLVQHYETLKSQMTEMAQNASVKSPQVSARDIQSLKENNMRLRQEVIALKKMLDQAEKAQYQEVSLTPKVEKKAVVSPSTSQDAKETVLSEAAEREAISELVSTEPAAGNIEEDVEYLGEMAGINQAQRLERQLKGEITQRRDVIVSKSAPIVSPGHDLQENTELAVLKEVEIIPSLEKSSQKGSQISTTAAVNGIEAILYQSGVKLASAVEKVEGFSKGDNTAYQWQGLNNIFGSAQQKPLRDAYMFDEYVREYLSNTENRCTGEFAVIPASTQETPSVRIDSYEIACVGGGVNSSAALVFMAQDGVFTALAHEAPTANMDLTMEARDKIVSSVIGS